MMENKYEPPFKINENIISLVAEISEYIGLLSSNHNFKNDLILRKDNQIKSIHSSLAIENNTLSLKEVTAIINGQKVLGPTRDIKEVENAYKAYEIAYSKDSYSIKDLLQVHKYMMSSLVKEAGSFRSNNVGVYAGSELIHAGTPYKYVPELMEQLFSWLKESELHPLIKSSIFHYEFEFIHPFNDGNGRMGRLWQSLILSKWKDIFLYIPIETMVYKHQQDYYNALQLSNDNVDSSAFVEFMLQMIKDTIKEIIDEQDVVNDVVNDVVINKNLVLEYISNKNNASAKEIANSLGLSSRQVQRYIAQLKQDNKLIRHGSNRSGYWEVIN